LSSSSSTNSYTCSLSSLSSRSLLLFLLWVLPPCCLAFLQSFFAFSLHFKTSGSACNSLPTTSHMSGACSMIPFSSCDMVNALL
jgi:hypothetical protein